MIVNKLHKILSQVGLGSRRSMEAKIREGSVKINGKIARLGIRASYNDKIVVLQN